MVLRRLIFILASCLLLTASASAQTRMFYRVLSGTNSAITAWDRSGTLAWTNAATGTFFDIQWAFDFRDFASGSVESVEYGTVTAIAMSVAAPFPTTPRPSLSTHRIIPSGSFLMGNADTNMTPRPAESPVHEVAVSALYIDKYEVRKVLWDEVRSWASTNGYSDMAACTATGGDHPAQTLTWYDCVKWCNARSEKEHLVPVYCGDSAKTNVYRTGTRDVEDSFVKWDANGYRLPTEAEWEKAARGGLVGNHFPWPSTSITYTSDIDGSKANYSGSGDAYETVDPSDTETTPVGYYDGTQPGADMTNGYGLYDTAGNVSEWCWDWYDASYYSAYPANAWPADPAGPASGSTRIVRGGNWKNAVGALRCSYRFAYDPLAGGGANIGFRCVRGL